MAKVQITVKIEEEKLKEMDKVADRLSLTRSQFIRNCIDNGFDDAKLLDAAGLFDAVKISRKLLKKFKEMVIQGKVQYDEDGELEINK